MLQAQDLFDVLNLGVGADLGGAGVADVQQLTPAEVAAATGAVRPISNLRRSKARAVHRHLASSCIALTAVCHAWLSHLQRRL